MSDALQVRAEVLKLARLLERSPEDLAYLQRLGLSTARQLREQTTDVLFETESRRFERLARLSRLLTPGLVATIAQHALGPLLSGRVTGYLDPEWACAIALRLPVAFRTELTIALDPRRASDVLRALPASAVAEVARELRLRDEYVTMGRFVGQLSDEAIRAVLAVIDDEAVLRVCFVVEEERSLDRALALFPTWRRAQLMRTAAAAELWPEALDLLSRLGRAQCQELADAAAEQAAVLDSMVRAVRDHGLWPALLPVARAMGDDSRRRLAARLAEHTTALNATQRRRVAGFVRQAAAFEELAELCAVLEAG